MATATADRWALRCAEPTHLEHQRVFMHCSRREPLAAFVADNHWACFELVDLDPAAGEEVLGADV